MKTLILILFFIGIICASPLPINHTDIFYYPETGEMIGSILKVENGKLIPLSKEEFLSIPRNKTYTRKPRAMQIHGVHINSYGQYTEDSQVVSGSYTCNQDQCTIKQETPVFLGATFKPQFIDGYTDCYMLSGQLCKDGVYDLGRSYFGNTWSRDGAYRMSGGYGNIHRNDRAHMSFSPISNWIKGTIDYSESVDSNIIRSTTIDVHTARYTSSSDLDGYYWIVYETNNVKCTGDHFGSGDGEGSNGDCCQTLEDCDMKHFCNTNNICAAGGHPGGGNGNHAGTGDGQGNSGDACTSNEDCQDTCNSNGKCGSDDGTGEPTKTTTAPKPTPTNGNHAGTGDGQGNSGDACTSNDDCKDTCNSNGKCGSDDGTGQPTHTTSSSDPKPTNDHAGTGDGQGNTGDLCTSNTDCQDTCNANGKCGVDDGSGQPTTTATGSPKPTSTFTRPKFQTVCNPTLTVTNNGVKTTFKPTPTSVPGGGSGPCLGCYAGLGLGAGPLGVVCYNNNDCQSTCHANICAAPIISPDVTTTTTNGPVTTNINVPTTIITNTPIPTTITIKTKVPTVITTNVPVPTILTTQTRVPTTIVTTQVIPTVITTTINNVPSIITTQTNIPTTIFTTINTTTIMTTYTTMPTIVTITTEVVTPITTQTNVPTTITTRTIPPTTIPTGVPTCLTGYCGKKNGGGPTGACCSANDDCQDTCNSNGKCGVSDETGPPKSGCNTPTCISGYCGNKNGTGPTEACCSTDNDCQDTCNSNGKCGVSDQTGPPTFGCQ